MILTGTHSAQYEREARGWQWIWPGVPPPANFVSPAVKRNVYIAQEQPDHPGPRVSPAVKPIFFLPTVPPAITTVQEQPDHPSATRINLPYSFAVRALVSHIFNAQEQPDFTPGWARAGVFPLFIAPMTSVIRAAIVQQEQPDHPTPSFTRGGIPTQNVVGVIPTYVVEQEFPDHPNSSFVLRAYSFVAPPPPPFSIIRTIVTQQEQPDVVPVWARGTLFPQHLPVIKYVLTVQEQPDFGVSWARVGIQQPYVTTPVPPSTGRPSIAQELPFHPNPFVIPWPGKFIGVPVVVPVPATYYLLEDMWVNNQYLLAGTVQSTADIGGVLPINWVPNPNVDPIDAGAIATYTAVGYRPRGLIRPQFSNVPVNPPVYNWKLINDEWVLIKGK